MSQSILKPWPWSPERKLDAILGKGQGQKEDKAWEQEALAAGLKDARGLRACCMSGTRQQCQNVNTRNDRHKPGSRKHAPLCTWVWHNVIREQYRAGEEGGGEEDAGEPTKQEKGSISFAGKRFRQGAGKFQPEGLVWVDGLASRLGGCKDPELFRSFMYWHVWWLKEQAESTMSESWKEWVEVALDAPTAAERAILKKFTPPAVDAFNRGRGIFATTQLWAFCQGSVHLWHALDVFFRYSGSVTFAEDVLMAEPFSLDGDWALQLSQRIVKAALLRTTVGPWFSNTDGRRRSYRKEVGEAKRLTEGTRFPYLNSMLAAASNWVEVSEKAACAFTHLLAAVRAAETGEDPGVQMAVGAYMQCILQYELVGRRGADKPGWEFGWDSIQAYGAKFPFSDGLGLLKRLACINSVCTSTCQCKPCTVCAQVDQMYSFFGPSPRVLYEEAVGRHDPLQFYRLLAKEFGHSLYGIQLSPCEWRQFLVLCQRLDGVDLESVSSAKTAERQKDEDLFQLQSEKISIFERLLQDANLRASDSEKVGLFNAFRLSSLMSSLFSDRKAGALVASFKIFARKHLYQTACPNAGSPSRGRVGEGVSVLKPKFLTRSKCTCIWINSLF